MASSPHEIWYLQLEHDRVPYELRSLPEGIRSLEPLGGGGLIPSPERWIPLVPRLEAVINTVQPDLVHAGPIQSCAFLAALAGFHPLLAMSWGSDILVDAGRDEFWAWMTRYALQHADILVSDCTEVSDAARRIAGLGSDRIVQFPWGVDVSAFKPGPDTVGLRHRPGWQTSTIVICTRSLETHYGVMHLLEGFRQALASLTSLRLVLAGSGSLRAEVERFVRENGLEEVVFLAGAVPSDRLPEYFRAADVYASCAYSDGSSISLLEAMATGLPVLATDRASNREWVGREDQGLLVPFGDCPMIARALLELAGLSANRRREIAAFNRAVIEERANWKHNSAKLFAAYESLRALDRSRGC